MALVELEQLFRVVAVAWATTIPKKKKAKARLSSLLVVDRVVVERRGKRILSSEVFFKVFGELRKLDNI
jgi:hypothetical protein